MKKFLLIFSLLIGLQNVLAQYEVRHQISYGYQYSDLRARKFDPNTESGIAINQQRIESMILNPDLNLELQKTKLDFITKPTDNYFFGYRVTLDFNKRYSFDMGILIVKKGYKTELDKEIYQYESFDELYGINKAFGANSNDYRYEEDFSHWTLELPFLYKQNLNSIVSAYGGLNVGIQIFSSDKDKPLAVKDIAGEEGGLLYLYKTDLATQAAAVVGLDVLLWNKISIFGQAEYTLNQIDDYRESGVHFWGIKAGMNIVFSRM